MPATHRLSTERLVLRQWADADREPFAAMNADPSVMEHFPAVMSPAQTDAFVDRIQHHWQTHGFGLWALERQDTGAFIGYVGLAAATFDAHFTPAVEVGWRLAREHWGHGYATEGASASLEQGFGALELTEIVSFTATGNARSRRVMERLGMTHDEAGDFEHPNVPEGHPIRPHVLYRLQRAHGRAR